MSFPQILLPLLVLVVVELVVNAATPSTPLAKPGCPHSCGNLTIPYPFGTSEGCSLNASFLITCENDSKPFLLTNNSTYNPFYRLTDVLDISLNGELRVSTWAGAYDCYNQSGGLVESYNSWLPTDFSISYAKNKITLLGCDTYAYTQDYLGSAYVSGCMSLCNNITDVINGSCSGIGCCQASIPKGVTDFSLEVKSYRNHTAVWGFNPCGIAFLAEEGTYIFSSNDLLSYNSSIFGATRVNLPVVFDWAVGSQTCEEARKNLSSYACGKNSICYNFSYGSGYRCNCSQGYHGNPYLPNGCQDINECSLEPSPCTDVCQNIDGSFICSCPEGCHGDGKKDGQGCISNKSWIKFLIGIAITAGALQVMCPMLYWGIRWRIKHIKQKKQKLFQKNGGLMIKEKLSKLDGSVEKAKIFSIKELTIATNNFDESGIIGRGGFGTVYKGVLPQNKIVAVKKSTIVDESQIEQFVNEVIVVSQINHKNVVKLLGCCLETEVPLLIYEFITNGTLYHHLHEVRHASSIAWKIRLRIAKEAATALAYLHSATSIPIIHRDVKSANILLDNNFTAKVSDFGASRLVPLDKTQLTTMVQGTLGYLDPEYFHTSHLSVKSDAYSFGVVLVELLTGRKALSFDKPEKERNLATYFLSSMRENHLSLILDNRILNEGNADEMREVANIAQSCLRLKGDKRPTMREVAIELERLTKVEKHLWTTIEVNPDETEFLLCESLNFRNITVGYDSVNDQDKSLDVDDGHPLSCTNLGRAMIRVP